MKKQTVQRVLLLLSLITRIIGKELEIRRTLSESHLYSSAFVVERSEVVNGVPQHSAVPFDILPS